MRPKRRLNADSPEIVSLRRAERLPLLSAAYILSQSAFVRLERRGRLVKIFLSGKSARASGSLSQAFCREYESQRVRWAINRSAPALSLEILRRMAKVPQDLPAESRQDALAQKELGAIDVLLAETAGKSAGDPLGIRTPWDQRR